MLFGGGGGGGGRGRNSKRGPDAQVGSVLLSFSFSLFSFSEAPPRTPDRAPTAHRRKDVMTIIPVRESTHVESLLRNIIRLIVQRNARRGADARSGRRTGPHPPPPSPPFPSSFPPLSLSKSRQSRHTRALSLPLRSPRHRRAPRIDASSFLGVARRRSSHTAASSRPAASFSPLPHLAAHCVGPVSRRRRPPADRGRRRRRRRRPRRRRPRGDRSSSR